MSELAKQRYLNSNDRINLNKLKLDAENLPSRHRNWNEFKQSFGNVRHYNYDFYGYKIHIDVRYAFEHFLKNTYNEHRANINATILPTLHNPLLVVKGYYENKKALTFYKPYINEDNIIHIMMYKAVLDDNGSYKFRTIYEAHTLKKVTDVIKALDLNTIYFKFGNNTEGSGS
jgi:hypothetical protein